MVLLTPYRALLVEDLLRDQQLPLGVDRPHPMSVPFIQATVFDNAALLRVNRNILPGYGQGRHSSANGCSAAWKTRSRWCSRRTGRMAAPVSLGVGAVLTSGTSSSHSAAPNTAHKGSALERTSK